jgi:acetyl esterase/lipase
MNVDALLDPEIAGALRALPAFEGGYTAESLPALRARSAARMAGIQLSDAVERTDVSVPGRDGAPEVLLRIHRPKGAAGPLPCVYSIHGGGYISGSYAADDLRFDRWCPELNCVGVSVEYRLAPETPYPGPLEDCYAGLDWIQAHAVELGIDPARIGIAGASAGGGLAAALALLVRDRAEFQITFQLLLYPMIDDSHTNHSSSWEVPIWSPTANRFGWDSYLGPLRGGDVPAYAAPTRATNLEGLPPALILVGALDGFLDEDIDYARRLNHAGVPCELQVYPGAPHGFDGLLPGAAVSRRARQRTLEWLRDALEFRALAPVER